MENTYEFLLSYEDNREVLHKGLCEEDLADAEEMFNSIIALPNSEEFEAGRIAAYKEIFNLFNLK